MIPVVGGRVAGREFSVAPAGEKGIAGQRRRLSAIEDGDGYVWRACTEIICERLRREWRAPKRQSDACRTRSRLSVI